MPLASAPRDVTGNPPVFWLVQWIGLSRKRTSCHDLGAHIPLQEGKQAATMRIADSNRRSGQVLIALMDEQEGLWETMQLHLNVTARTVPVLDILHALALCLRDRESVRARRTRAVSL